MNSNRSVSGTPDTKDYGPEPLIVNIDCFAKQNTYYRTTLWTGNNLQVTLMSIPIHGDVGGEVHSDFDQFIRIENGCALVKMGKSDSHLSYQQRVGSNHAVMIPAGTWHNIINTGNIPLTLYSIYAPPQHPFETVHTTKEAAKDAEKH